MIALPTAFQSRGRVPKPRFSRRFFGALQTKRASVPIPLRLSSGTAASGSFAIPSPPTSLFLARRFCFSSHLSPQTAARLAGRSPLPRSVFFACHLAPILSSGGGCVCLPGLVYNSSGNDDEEREKERVVGGNWGRFSSLLLRAPSFWVTFPKRFLCFGARHLTPCARLLSGALEALGGMRTALVGKKSGGRH